MGGRRAKSSISRLPAEQRTYVERLLRDGRLTLDEMIADLQARFSGQPAADVSRSALHRYEQGFAELTGRMREIEAASAALVGELGEGIGEKSGALLAQAVTTLATNAALLAHERENVSIEDVRKLARAAKDVIDTRRMSLAERQAIEKAAQDRLLREQRNKLDSLGKTGTITPETLQRIRQDIYGLT